jgi:hypothetical protein
MLFVPQANVQSYLLAGLGSESAGPVAEGARNGTIARFNRVDFALGHRIELFRDAGETDIEKKARSEPVDDVVEGVHAGSVAETASETHGGNSLNLGNRKNVKTRLWHLKLGSVESCCSTVN